MCLCGHKTAQSVNHSTCPCFFSNWLVFMCFSITSAAVLPNFVKQLLNVNPVCSAYLVNLWYCARSGASTVVLTNASASWAAAGWLRDYKETEAAALCMKPRYSVRQKEPGPTRRLNWSTRDEDPLLRRW